jgi:hypothetical protein
MAKPENAKAAHIRLAIDISISLFDKPFGDTLSRSHNAG